MAKAQAKRKEAVMNAIDVDVGGTFTDIVVSLDGKNFIAKEPTTPQDLSICFMNAIEKGADECGLSMEELLSRISLVRYSTTVALNRLIQRKGPRIGLITTEGFEDTLLIGRGAQWVDGKRLGERRNLAFQQKPIPLVERDLTVGVRERVDSMGHVIAPLDEADVRRKLRHLIDRGARAIVISLLWSFINPQHERRIKDIIREEYKEYHIGYLPIILASEVVAKIGEYERTMTAVLDAYLQRSLQTEISAIWDKLRERRYRGSFLMIHNTGGCAEIFKTQASRTFNGGPVSGLIGSAHFASELGYKNVVFCDMGGTSFDVGLVVESGVRSYEFRPVVDTWMVAITMHQIISIGAGGGSIAKVNRTLGNRLEVGPASAGSMPGPVCYDMGGAEPTVTDADVVLGYIDPDNYYGGRMPLNKAKAERAIREKIAEPLGVSVEEAAVFIRRVIDEHMASAIKREVHMRGYYPEDFVVFAVGGAGPTHAAGFKADISKAIIFPSSPVFCAMGSSVMDILHLYEVSKRMVFAKPVTEELTADYEAFNQVVETLMENARQDLMAEGLPVEKAVFNLELDMLYGGQVNVKRMASPVLFIRSPEDVQRVCDAFEKEFSEAFSPLVINKPGGTYIESFALKVAVPTAKPSLPVFEMEGADPARARKGSRRAYWPETQSYADTPVFSFDELRPGNVVEGPALVEAPFTAIVVPPGQKLSIDCHGLGVIENIKAEKTLRQQRQGELAVASD